MSEPVGIVGGRRVVVRLLAGGVRDGAGPVESHATETAEAVFVEVDGRLPPERAAAAAVRAAVLCLVPRQPYPRMVPIVGRTTMRLLPFIGLAMQL